MTHINTELIARATLKGGPYPCNCHLRYSNGLPSPFCHICRGAGKFTACHNCSGTGFDKDTQKPCQKCDGRGTFPFGKADKARRPT